ncbi:MAG: S8 family serine peptidase [Pseudomonadota bacterium]
MKTFKNGLARTLAYLLAVQPILTTGAGLQAATNTAPAASATTDVGPVKLEPRELTGYFEDTTADMADRGEDGLAEDGTPATVSPIASLPIVDDALSERLRSADKDTPLRIIVHLDYLPHAEQFQRVMANHGKDIEKLEADRSAFAERQKALRATDGSVDAENYRGVHAMSAEDTQTLRAIKERHEALSLTVKEEAVTAIRALVEPSQGPVKAAIMSLGGNVEFTTIAGNMIIATIAPDAIAELANEPGILRIVEDSEMESHLREAAAASMVDPEDTSLLGLWDNGADGGIYDPAIIDSGMDLTHPGMQDNAGRANFSSWYVVAGVGSSSYDETCCSIDDWQGHGTHVAGIVGSYGTGAYPQELGMAFGAEKVVHLKAGWLNTSGRASMFWSDKYNLVDRALYNADALSPANSFLDDVDGMNLSYGGSTTLDDTDGGRFWDSVVSTYPDLPVTISAGNSGPSNTIFNDPAVSYNAIAVAAADDRDTLGRTDDIIASYSTRGPTASGRKKPDIAAPGTDIFAPNTFWESQADYVDKDGTSMAAPMVLGVIMDLMDAGVFDEKALKAVLINTAQKNLSSMNIESDSDGWDEAIGWGYMNAYAAYFHRFDYFLDSVEPRLSGGTEYQLYKGSMQDEGSSGEGRDRATMVWNRAATYDTAAAPTDYYNLTDLNLRLYREEDNFLIDDDLDGNDNVQQVRINSGAAATDVVINAYAWSSVFDNGLTAEPFALATEEGFTRVDHPATFQGIAIWPTSVEPNEIFDIEFWLRNDSELASHNNNFNLELPAGWTLISGIDTQNVGSAAGGGGNTAHVTYTIQAGPTLAAETVRVAHTHNSYNQNYGSFNWNMGITVEWDNVAPTPNPMSFSTLPFNVSTSSISMTASSAFDDRHNPVEYYLDYINSPTGGFGGNDSGWQSSRTYQDDGLSANHEYCYQSWAQDSSTFPNLTSPSTPQCTYSSIETPAGVDIGAITTTSIQVKSSSTPSNLNFGISGLQLTNTITNDVSGYVQGVQSWTNGGLTPATSYVFNARARNGDGDVSGFSPSAQAYTLANPPAVDGLFVDSDTSIKVSLNPNGNGNAAEYFIQNTTNGTNSGWTNQLSWLDSGLTCGTSYNYQARARNGAGIETIIVPLGQQTTPDCSADTDGDGVVDADDNCTLVINPAQRDTDGDGYGNYCDPDLNQDLQINFTDLGMMKSVFFTPDPDADLDGDGAVSFSDLSILKQMFFTVPGPSGQNP